MSRPITMTTALFTLVIITSCMQKTNISGEYHLTGVPEMASAFRFTPDGQFEFFWIYGAADRMAKGTYSVSGDTIRLKSEKEAGDDFEIKAQHTDEPGYTIRVIDPNSILASNVRCIYFVNGEQLEEFTNNEGLIKIDAPKCEKIYVQHALYPDIATLIKEDADENNYFELKLKPILQQVSFKGVDFFIKDNHITCHPNYFLPMSDIRFVKSKT